MQTPVNEEVDAYLQTKGMKRAGSKNDLMRLKIKASSVKPDVHYYNTHTLSHFCEIRSYDIG